MRYMQCIVATRSEDSNKITGAPGIKSAADYSRQLFGSPTLPFLGYSVFRIVMGWATLNNMKIIAKDGLVWTDAATYNKDTIRLRVQRWIGNDKKSRIAKATDTKLETVFDELGDAIVEKLAAGGINSFVALENAVSSDYLVRIPGIGKVTAKTISRVYKEVISA